MEGIGLVNLIADIGFVMVMLFIATKAISSKRISAPENPNLKEVEKSIRGMMEEAEQSGRDLSKELSKRQRALEQMLFDLETVENKLQRATTLAEDKIEEIQKIYSAPVPKEIPAEKQSRPIRLDSQIEAEESAEQLSSIIEEIMPTTKAISTEQVDRSKVNIFGEPLDSEDSPSSGGLTSKIEIEREENSSAQGQISYEDDGRERVQQIYNKAKELLQSGMDIATVSMQTALPRAAVAKIRDRIMPEEEFLPTPTPKRDGRLGVLGAMKRSAEIL